jgi:drug/metabolite transporter (DMT)-like permease
MGIGAAIGFFTAGAILYWAVDVDLPYMDDDALGAILLFAGALALAFAVIMNTRRSREGTSVGSGVGLIAVGAILYWAVNIDVPYIFDGALGVILMAAGAIAVFATVVMHFQGPSGRSPRQYDHYA